MKLDKAKVTHDFISVVIFDHARTFLDSVKYDRGDGKYTIEISDPDEFFTPGDTITVKVKDGVPKVSSVRFHSASNHEWVLSDKS